MNILFCYRNTMNPNKGGVQRVCDILAKYFIGKGHKVFYLNFLADDVDSYMYPAKIYQLPDTDFFSKPNRKYYHNLLNTLSIDIMVNHDATNDRAKFFLDTGISPVKKISLYHSNPMHGLENIPSGHILKIFYKTTPTLYYYLKRVKKKNEINYLIKNSDKLILLSEEFRNQICSILKINSSKIESISNPIELNNNASFDLEKKKKQILFVGRLEFSQKKPDTLLSIWSKLEKKHPDWELVFLGDGPDRAKLEEMVKLLDLTNVRFEGFVDPNPYYENASILCMTSDYEGFGLVLIEAMQFGVVPIVFNNWSSLQDIISDNNTGILVKSNDIEEYIMKLEKLLTEEKVRKKIAENAKVKSSSFDIETIGKKWFDLFERL